MADQGPGDTGSHAPRVLFIFLDGVGIGSPSPEFNPFLTAELPNLKGLLGGRVPTLDHPEAGSGMARALPLDPLLGVDGLPQSGTGQTALLTGENAPALFGRHFGPWVPVRLRPLLAERNLLVRAQAAGLTCLFANAYPSQYLQAAWSKRPSGPALAAHSAGLLNRHEDHLARGEALSSELVNTAWRRRLGLTGVPDLTPAEAGRKLAHLTTRAHLTFFAHYSTDTAGHERELAAGVRALERVDAFLGDLMDHLPDTTLVILASDHGNLEDTRRGHTANPTLCVLAGSEAGRAGEALSRITDVPGMILTYLTSS